MSWSSGKIISQIFFDKHILFSMTETVFSTSPGAVIIWFLTTTVSLLAFLFPPMKEGTILLPFRVFHRNEYYRIFTSGMVHKNGYHFMINMIAYYLFAFQLEMLWGSLRFTLLYIVSLIVSNLSTIIKYRNTPDIASMGASGAIHALALSLLVLNPDRSIRLSENLEFPLWGVGAIYIVYNFLLAKNKGSLVNHEAHLWGAICGALLTLFLTPQIWS